MADYQQKELPFTEEWQEAIIGHCITNPNFFSKCKGKLQPNWFSKNILLATIYDQLVKSFDLNGVCVKSPISFKGEMFFNEQKHADREKFWNLIDRCVYQAGNVELEKLEKNLTGFLRVSMFKEAIEGSARIYRTDGYEDAFLWTNERLKMIKDASFVDNKMIMSFDNPDKWIEDHEIRKGDAISTGCMILDDALGGGLFKKEACAFLAPANVGKCLGLDTPVLMFDGSIKKVQDIKLGDQLMGPDSLPRNVLSTTTGRGQLYKIIPKTGGMEWICNDVHVLSLKTTYGSGFYKRDKIVNIPVNEYLQKSNNFKRQTGLWRAKIEFTEAMDLPMDPYILGLWLGDGTTLEASLTSVDSEIIEAWTAYANAVGMGITRSAKKTAKHVGTYRVSTKSNFGGRKRNVIKEQLRAMKLIGNKHIPQAYLIGSTEQRMELLAGLIDTDGYVMMQSRGGIEILSKIDRLSSDIAYLARSLGFRVSCKKVNKSIKSIGFKAEYNKISIGGDIESIPLRLTRKKTVLKNSIKNPLTTHFTVENAGVGDYYGFELDGDHLFMLGDFTVTHNTTAMITLARHAIWQHKKVLFIIHEGFPEEIRLRFLASFLGVSTKTIYQWRLDPSRRQLLMAAAEAVKKNLTYVPYIKTNAMFVEDVIEMIKKLHEDEIQRTGRGYDMVIDDYPKKLKSRQRSGQREGLYRVEVAEIYDSFNHLASEIDVHCFLAIQTNRTGLKQNNGRVESEFLLGMEEMDESFGIAQNVPNIITLNRSPQDKVKNIMRMNVTRSRNSETDIAIITRTNYSCCLSFGDKNMFEIPDRWPNELDNGYLPAYAQKDNSKPDTELLDRTLAGKVELKPNIEGIGAYVAGAAIEEKREDT